MRPHDKLEFDTMCINITGKGCGYKAADAVSKKRSATEGISRAPDNSFPFHYRFLEHVDFGS